MAEFTPINTQEELNAVLGPRLARERETIEKQYSGRIAEYDKQITELKGKLDDAGKQSAASAQQLTELQAKVKGYETDSVKTRIALELGLPYQMAGRLTGETEEDIRRDAESLRGMMSQGRPVAPLAKEPDGVRNADEALRGLLSNMKK